MTAKNSSKGPTRFDSVLLTRPESQELYAELYKGFVQVERVLSRYNVCGREAEYTHKALEEALFWARRAIEAIELHENYLEAKNESEREG